jgi:exopolysaccharide biosynthesis polyprenyl glycosylphosphotransferase
MHVARHPVLPLAPTRASGHRGGRILPVWLAALVLLDALAFVSAYLDFLQARGAAELPYLAPVAICLGAVGIVFIAADRYSLRRDTDSVRFAAEHGLACVIAFALALLLQFATVPEVSRSRLSLLGSFALFAPISLVFRRVLGRAARRDAGGRTLIVLGAGPEAVDFYRACRRHGVAQALRFVDLAGKRAGERLDGDRSPLIEQAAPDELNLLVDSSVEAMVLAEPLADLAPGGVDALVRAHFRQAPILTLEAFSERYWKEIPVSPLDPVWALRQDFRLARDSPYCFFKRAFDLVASTLGLVLAAPFFLICVVALRLESAGPAFYCQTRVRRDRRPFRLYKFRTMRVEAAAGAVLYTGDGDRRVTRVGRWLRRMRLDELPQLFNVLQGDMSLIGPRAEWDRCVEVYEREIPCYHFRHLVKPGITGWAQVNYPYGQSVADTIEKLKYDLYYIKNYSLLLDASIALKTLYVMLSLKGR